MNYEQPITVQEVSANPVEYIDLYIPIVRHAGGNYWLICGCYLTEADAIEAIRSWIGIADAKILHHTERFVVQTKESEK